MKKTILTLGWEFPPNSWGGLGKACYGLVKGLTQEGMFVKLILPNKQKTTLQHCNIIHAKTNLEHTPSKKTISVKKKIYSNLYTHLSKRIAHYSKSSLAIAQKEQFDIIHAHDWMTLKAAINIKKVTQKPLIVHIHSTEIDRHGYKNKKKDIYTIEKTGMEYADKIITVSNFTKKRIVKYYNIAPQKIAVVHNAIYLEKESCYKDIHPIKQVSGKDSFKVLFLGRLTWQKGPEYFLDAAQKILQSTSNVHFLVVGDGDMKHKLIKQASQLGIGRKITFTGFVQGCNVDKMYKAADIYVMPSVCEPFGLSPLEAMKNGTPVVVSKDAGVCEIIKNCVKVNYRNTDMLAKKIINLLKSKHLRTQLAMHGKEEIKQLTWNKAAKKCINVYKEVCSYA